MRPKHSLNHNIESVPLVLTGDTQLLVRQEHVPQSGHRQVYPAVDDPMTMPVSAIWWGVGFSNAASAHLRRYFKMSSLLSVAIRPRRQNWT